MRSWGNSLPTLAHTLLGALAVNLLNEQQVAYSLVMRGVREAKQSDSREVIVVTGGPGRPVADVRSSRRRRGVTHFRVMAGSARSVAAG